MDNENKPDSPTEPLPDAEPTAEQTETAAYNAPVTPDKADEGKGLKIFFVSAVSALLIIILIIVYLLLTPASAPVSTETESGTAAAETDALQPPPDSAYAYEFTKTDKNGVLSGKNVIIIQLPSLGCGIIGNSYNSVEITPNLNALLGEAAYFPNNVSGAADITSLDFVLNNSLYAPEYDSALMKYADIELYGLTQLLSEAGYTTLSFTYGDKNAYGGDAAYSALGYQKHISMPLDKIASASVYDTALGELKSTNGSFYAVLTDVTTLYPYFNTDNTSFDMAKISGSAKAAGYVKAMNAADTEIGKFIAALKDAGLYEDTVLVVTGTGGAFALDDTFGVKGMTALNGEYNIDDYIKAPLIMKLPGIPAAEYDALCSHTDFMPTMVEIMGLSSDGLFSVGENLFTTSRDSLRFQSILLRGSYIDSTRAVSVDETGIGRNATAYNFESGKTGAAGSSNSIIKENIAYFEEFDKAIASGIVANAKTSGRAKAIAEFENTKENMEKVYSYSVADAFPENESSDFYKNDTKVFNKSVMVSANEFDGAFISTIFKNDGLTLIPGSTCGSFISGDVSLGGKFTEMLASWNAYTTDGTVEVSVSVKKADGTYTDWYSWGVWSAQSGISGSRSSSDRDGKLDIDTLLLSEEAPGYIRFRIDLVKTGEEAPAVFNVTFACNKTTGKLSAPSKTSVKLTVNKRYQYDVPDIGGRICSPTSLSMALDYWGQSGFETADTAAGVYDNSEQIYGNWSYNVAWAGELGYNAYLDYYDIGALKYTLSKNIPVVCSVRVRSGQLSGSGMPNYSTDGHLLCAVGYESVDGVEWISINDPASAGVEIRVLASEFEQIWRGVVYIVQPHPERYTWRIGEGTDRDILIVADYIPEGRYNRPGGNYRVRYIVVHNTGNFNTGAYAVTHGDYIKQSGTQVSWHYHRRHSIFKHLPEEERAWHAWDGREGKGNTYGIGIEICVNHETEGTTNPTQYFKNACSNAAQLVAELMYKYNLKISAVKQHYDFSGKNCPQVMRENDMWDDFITEVQSRYDAIVASRGE